MTVYGRGQILRVDLTSEKIEKEPVPADLGRKHLGGEGVNVRLLWEHFLRVDPRTDPLSPGNILIMGMGPLGATGLGVGSKTQFTFKSPVTNIYGDSSSGGLFGCQMRWAGYDHIVITGKARRPVYLWVNDDDVQIRDAGSVWGQPVEKANERMRHELGHDDLETACIGPAGENLVKYACIVASGERAAGRCGGGGVLGSKNLKAIAALGTKGVPVHDPPGFLRAMREVNLGLYKEAGEREKWKSYGTLGSVKQHHNRGNVAYRNGQGPDTLVPIDQLDEQWYVKNLQDRQYIPCAAGCASACGNWCQIKGTESGNAANFAGERGVRPEYGNWAAFAGACEILDMPTVVHLTNKCTQYGMDTFEVGLGIALIIELRERGIVTEGDILDWTGEALDLKWGNWEAVQKVIDMVALQQNKLGKILRGGVYQAALALEQEKGVNIRQYANYGKAGATHEQTSRGWPAMAVANAVAQIGAHHSKGQGLSPVAAEYFLGDREAGNLDSPTKKGMAHCVSENVIAITNSLGICRFLIGGRRWDPVALPLDLIGRAVTASTGVPTTGQDLLTGGERLVNQCKAFNSRLGLRRKDDTVCERWLKEPLPYGQQKGWKAGDYLEILKDEYYEARGWDKTTSLPSRKKLEQLSMADVADVLESAA